MLDRIINITPGSDFKGASRNPKFGKKFSLYSTFQSNTSNDSIQISPATSFLANIRWKLKKFTSDQQKLSIVFEFDGFEFMTHFSVGELIQLQRIDYDVMKHMDNLGTLVKVSSRISVFLSQQSIKMNFLEHLNHLSEFFSRLISSGFRIPSDISDELIMKNLLLDIENSLTDEFEYINSCLLQFVEKFSSQKLIIPGSEKNDESGLIIKNVNIG